MWHALPLVVIAALFFAYPTRTTPIAGQWDSHAELLPKGLLWTVPWNDGRELHWQPWQQAVGNLYVIFGMAVLIATATWLAKTRSQGPRAATPLGCGQPGCEASVDR
jgi:hypothetical protein